MSMQEIQLAHWLKVAKDEITFCNYIINYPNKKNRKNFDPSSDVDRFYKSVANAFFNDCLLIVTTLLDKDVRVMSLWNLQVLANLKKIELQKLSDEFKSKGFISIRDQMIAHIDSSNKSNTFPDSRRVGLVRKDIVESLDSILSEMIDVFCDYAKSINSRYSSNFFSANSAQLEIDKVMDGAIPTLTDNDVI